MGDRLELEADVVREHGHPLGMTRGVLILRLERADEDPHRVVVRLLERHVGGEGAAGYEDGYDDERDDHAAELEVETPHEDTEKRERATTGGCSP